MTSENKRTLISLILNALTALLVILYLILSSLNIGTGAMSSAGWGILKYYTVLSNILAAISASVLLVYQSISLKKETDISPLWAILLKFVSTVALMVTFSITALFLGPTSVINGGTYWSMFEGLNLIVHFLVPGLAFASFCFFEIKHEIKFPYSFLGLSTVILYGIFYIINYYCHLIPGEGVEGQSQYDWYGFFQNNDIPVVVITVILILSFTYLLSFLLYFLNRKMRERALKKESL